MYSEETTEAASLRFPDFVIGGAPKCGTTSIHMLLGQHPDIGIPDNEILFHDADDPIVHNDFFQFKDNNLLWFNPTPEDAEAVQWYSSRFEPYKDRQLIGEDSPTYLFSEVAAQRIKDLMPHTKLVFMLRNPVKRAYSQYWHLVRSGRATESFEKTLVKNPSILLGSTYAPYLRQYLNLFGSDQICVILFEEFVAAPQKVLNEITDFIGVERFQLDHNKLWENRTTYPISMAGQLALNQIGRRIVATRYRKHMGGEMTRWERIMHKTHYRWFAYINPLLLRSTKAPPIKPQTLEYLQSHLSARNSGLSELLGRDLSEVWDGLTV